MERSHKKPLILIGGAANYFDSNGDPIPVSEEVELKFMMIQNADDKQIKMLIMKEWQPHEYHAQALKQYMEENSLMEIKENGGAKITLRSTYTLFWGRSHSLGQASAKEVEDFSKAVWPTMKCIFSLDDKRKGMAIAGIIRSRKRIEQEIKKLS